MGICLPSFVLAAKQGANKVCAMLWMYGPPPNAKALIGLFEAERERERWQKYIADMAWATVKALKPKFGAKPYEFTVHKSAFTDSRTGQEIVDDLSKQLRRRKTAREVKKQNEIV